ncbi:hypothetical protein GIB67_002300, partial [Kingdonia uniflora]
VLVKAFYFITFLRFNLKDAIMYGKTCMNLRLIVKMISMLLLLVLVQEPSDVLLKPSDGRIVEKLMKDHNKELLTTYGTDLSKMARQLNPVIGRQEPIDRFVQILCRLSKNNPCLIGEPGAGKSTIAEGLAQCIVDKEVLSTLQDTKLYSIDIARLIAGTHYRGDFEERLVKLIDEAKQIGAGKPSGKQDAANILKPALARGEIKCMAATTHKEYKMHIEKDPALERRFQPVKVPEPTVEKTIQILQGLRAKYETHHKVHYEHEAFVSSANLSHRYIMGTGLDDVLLTITHCGICYTDVAWAKNIPRNTIYPVVPGYVCSRAIYGSVAGGTKDMLEMFDFCAANNIYPEVEVISIQYVNEALERMENRDVKYRFAIDVKNSLK